MSVFLSLGDVNLSLLCAVPVILTGFVGTLNMFIFLEQISRYTKDKRIRMWFLVMILPCLLFWYIPGSARLSTTTLLSIPIRLT